MGKDELQALGRAVMSDYTLVQILGYLSIKEIFTLLIRLNKKTYHRIKEENYICFWKLIWSLNIPSTFEASDLAIRENIIEVIKRTYTLIKKNEIKEIVPFAYFTDGGSYQN